MLARRLMKTVSGGIPVALIPTLTGNTFAGGSVSASSQFGASYPPWKACDGNLSVYPTGGYTIFVTAAAGDPFPREFNVTFDAAKTVTTIVMGSGYAGGTGSYAPKNINLQYSDDGSIWITAAAKVQPLDTNLNSHATEHFTPHRYWRIQVVNNWALDPAQETQINYVQFMGY